MTIKHKHGFLLLLSVIMVTLSLMTLTLCPAQNTPTYAAALPELQSDGLALFLDWGYHYSDSPKVLASRLKKGGVTTIYFSGWYRNQDYSTFAKQFIDAAHANGILVYLWLEFPMVSETFWKTYPEYREKTALGKDAQIDWRYLMALDTPKCFDLAIADIKTLYKAHPWDGINFAELYYDSPAGLERPEKLTPFNATTAALYATHYGKDITQFFSADGTRSPNTSDQDLEQFMTFRQTQLELLSKKSILALKPILSVNNGDLVLTQIDNYLDPYVASNIGISKNYYKQIEGLYPYQLLIEDPFSLWHLDAERYVQLGNYYKSMNFSQVIGVDINIVTRLHNNTILPKQAGEELMRLIQQASSVFSFVALYSANSIDQTDLVKIPKVLATGSSLQQLNATQYKITATTKVNFNLATAKKRFKVNGKPWAAYTDSTLFLPPGVYTVDIQNAPQSPGLSDYHFTDLPTSTTRVLKSDYGITLSYNAAGKTFVRVSHQPVRVTIDGLPFLSKPFKDANASGLWYLLPKGKHAISFYSK